MPNKFSGMTIDQVVFDIQKRVAKAGQGEAFNKAVLEDDFEKVKSILLASGCDADDIGEMESGGSLILKEDLIRNVKKKTGRHEYRSDLALYNKWLKNSLLFGVPMFFALSILFYTLVIHRVNAQGTLMIIFLIAILGVGMYFTMKFLITHSRVITSDTQIIYHGLLGTKRIIDLNKPVIGAFTYYRSDTPISSMSSFGMLIIKNAASSKHNEIRIMDAYYDVETLAQVAKAASIEYTPSSHTPKEIEALQPGLMRFSELHPMIFAAIAIPVILVVLGAIVYPLTMVFNP